VGLQSFTFDTVGGEAVAGYVLESGPVRATLVSHGARLQALQLPDRAGRVADVVLGCPDVAGHLESQAYFGATCGRYANRIRDGRFEIDGRTIEVSRNQNGHHLHGGFSGFDRKIWGARPDPDGKAVTFATLSEDGEEGFPGRLAVSTTYRLEADTLEIVLRAETGRPTVLNLVNHTYWNLAGEGSGDVRDHVLQVEAGFFTPVDDDGIPSGEIRSVEGTPFDFRDPKTIGRDLDAVGPSAHARDGYDQNFCVAGPARAMRRFASLMDPGSGRGLELSADAPGLQVYAGGHLGPHILGKRGPYRQYGGVALEAQTYPDAPNVGHFPSARLDPGKVFERRMRFRSFVE
jgi:aldose 1-epimerase